MADSVKVLIEAILNDKGFQDGINGIKKTIPEATSVLTKFKSLIAGIGVTLTAAFAVRKIIQGIKDIISTAKEFEQAIANVASVSGGAKDALAKLARQAGVDTVFSARQAADAMYFLASAGLDVKDMAKVLTPTLNLAAAAQIGIAEATDLVVGQLKTFRASMSDAEKFTDIMANTVSKSNTDMNQLGEALKFAGAIAAQNGIPFEKLTAVIGAMADQGIKGSMAGSQLRMSLTNLIAPTTAAQAVLAKYNITQEQINASLQDPIKLFKLLKPVTMDAADAVTVFGVRQQNVIGIIKNGIPNLEKLTSSIKNSGGAAQRMADVQIDTLEGSLKLLNSAWEEQSISIAEKFTPALKSGIDFTTKLIKPEKNLVTVTGDLIKYSKEYAYITKTLATESKNLTEMEKAKLEVRKAELKIGIAGIIGQLNNLYIKQGSIIPDLTKKNKLLTEQMMIRRDEIKRLSDLEEKYSKSNTIQQKQLVLSTLQGKINEQSREFNKLFIEQAKNEKDIADATNEYNEALKTLALGLKNGIVSTADLIGVDKTFVNAAIELSKTVDLETDALEDNASAAEESGNKKEKAIVKTSNTIIGKYKEELAQLKLNEATQLANAKGNADEKLKIEERFLISKRELNAKYGAEIIEVIRKQAQEVFDLAGSFIDAASERQAMRHEEELAELDRQHEEVLNRAGGVNEQLAALDEADRLEKLATLQQELLDAQIAGDTELAAQKERAIKRMNLEKEKTDLLAAQAKERTDLEHKQAIEKAKTERASAILDKTAAIFGIAANTAAGIMKAVAASPLTLGMPWAGIIGGMGLAQGVAAGLKPLPEIPSFKKGTDKTSEGLAMLHNNERIIPERLNIPGISNDDLMNAAMRGLDMSGASGGTSMTNKYDNRKFNNAKTLSLAGANITVVSNDPDDMLDKLEKKANAMGTSLF